MKWLFSPIIAWLWFSRRAVAVWLLLLIVLAITSSAFAAQENRKPVIGEAPAKEAQASPAETGIEPQSIPPGPVAIPPANVATRAAEVAELLHTLGNKLERSDEIDSIMQSFPSSAEQSAQGGEETLKLLQRRPALPTLQAEQLKWQKIQLTYSNWLSLLTQRSKDLQGTLNQLAALKTTWSLTLDSAKASNIPDATLNQISEILTDIRNARAPLEANLSAVLDFQSQVGNAVARSGAILAKITQLQEASMSGTLVQDSLPIWHPDLWTGTTEALSDNFRSAVDTCKIAFDRYFHKPLGSKLLHASFCVLLIIVFEAFRRKTRELIASGLTCPPAVRVFDHPFAAALTIVLLIASSPVWSQMPATIRDVFQLLALVPMIVLIRPIVSAQLLPCLYVLGGLFALETCREIFPDEKILSQLLLTVEPLIGVVVTIWFLRKHSSVCGDAPGKFRLRLLKLTAGLVLCAFIAGFATAAIGYVRLSLLITPGVIAAGVLALSLYAFLEIAVGTVAMAFSMWPLRTLGMVQHHRALLERSLYHVLVLAAVLGLIARYLSYLGLLAPTLELGKTILEVRFERGILNVTLGEVLEFIVTVWMAYLLSVFLRFVLGEDVYPRLKMHPGKSYAVSSLLHYVILVLGVVVAATAVGLNLTKLTVLTGAIGIGLGFGLQGVVNNFVSGLILLCERPIHVGDTVEVGSLVGSIRKIGIRACTVQTLQGADIIVPNSQMVADKVTNWTLSDRLRRIELPVGVSYGTSPEDVIRLLEEVALKNPGVVRYPAPQGVMVGYGDSSLNFELWAWTDQLNNWILIRSKLAIAVYNAVESAGMTFPFPQREIRLLKDIEEPKRST